MVICLERGADLHMAQLMPLPLTVSCFSKIQIGFTFLVPAHLGSPGQSAVKRVCVCVMAVVVGFHRVYIVLMETMREGGKLSLSSDQLMELTSSLSFLSSAQALPVKTQSLSRSSTPLNADDQQQLSELQPLSLPANDLPGTSLPLLFARARTG